MAEKIRFGIMGCGGIANKFCEAVDICEDTVTTACASKSAERAADFAKRHNIPFSGSYDALLAREDVDVVYIATTHNFHAELIRASLLAGKHVICEKAMVLTKADAESLFALAKERGLFLMEAMWSRFLPTVQWAKKHILDGTIGTLQFANAVIGFKGNYNPESRLLNPALAGGAMYDIGVYPLEIVSYLIGEPVKSVSFRARPNKDTGVDERVSMLIEFSSVDAAIQCMLSCSPREFVSVTGDKGYIEIPTASYGDTAFRYDENRNLVEEWRPAYPGGNGFVYEIEEVVRCLRAGKLESDVEPASATIECAGIFDTVLADIRKNL